MKFDFSIIIPVHNNENSLDELLERTANFSAKINASTEIICVNDGSKDGSWEKLKAIKSAANYPLKLLNLEENYGQHKALICGLGLSNSNAAILLDADLQIPPEEISKLIETYKESNAKVVYGLFESKKHNNLRNFGSSILGKLLKRYGAYQAKGSSFKLIDRAIIEKVCSTNFEYIFIDELIAWQTNDIAYANVEHHERLNGKSSYSFPKLIKMAVLILFNYTTFPLRLMTYSGLTIGIVCFFLGLYFIYMKLVYGSEVGFTATIVAILFSTGIMLFSMGIIGEYVRKLYFVQLSKPPFKVKEIVE